MGRPQIENKEMVGLEMILTIWPKGIPVEPPDLTVDWDGRKREIQDAFMAHGLFSWQDIQHSPLGLFPAITVFKRYMTWLFREN
jgi:hypothetical protein